MVGKINRSWVEEIESPGMGFLRLLMYVRAAQIRQCFESGVDFLPSCPGERKVCSLLARLGNVINGLHKQKYQTVHS